MMDSGKDPASASAGKAAEISRAGRFIRLWLDDVRACFPTAKGISTIPYPGLRSFVPELNQFFCARDIQKEALHSFFAGDGSGGLGPRRLTFVVGGSGSGKSSLTRAGLIAELGAKSTKDHWGAWYVLEMRPATDPVAQLQAALWKDVLRPLIDAFFPERKAEKSAPGGLVSNAMPLDRLVAALRSLGIEMGEAPTHEDVVAQVDRWLEEKISPRPGRISSSGLFSFVSEALSALDLAASAGDRGGPPMLLLHIDQFEEVFRDECSPDGRASLIGLLRDIHNFRPEWLFAVATMRSEELHRLSEHQGMAEAINTSLFLVELVGNDNIETAIVEPARRMAQRWELPVADFMQGNKAPYTAAAVQDLKDAYREADSVLEHKADKLPLLQHALPLIWSAAVDDWIGREKADPGAKFVIDVEHLARIPGWKEAADTESKSRLGRSLNASAQSAYDEAARIFAARIADFPTTKPDGSAANPVEGSQSQLQDEAKGILTVALNCLAQLDDRRNVVRRFVPLSEMLKSAAGIERLQGIPRATVEAALKAALGVFERAGLVERLADEDPETEDLYNVTHESLIRNWVSYRENLKQQWLLQKRLYTFTRPDFKLKDDKDYGFLARYLRRNWAEAATAIQKLSRDALKLAFGQRPLYSTSWVHDSLRRAEEREKSQPLDEKELSQKLEKVRAACDNAEQWETNENYFTLLERRVLGGGAALAVTVTLLFGAAAALIRNLDQSYETEKQLNLIVWLQEFGQRRSIKSAIHDRVLGLMLQHTGQASKEKSNDEKERSNLRRMVSLIDTGVREVYGNQTVVSFTAPVDESDINKQEVDCTPLDGNLVEQGATPNNSGEIVGQKCMSGQWQLTFGWWRDNPSIDISLKSEPSRRFIESSDSLARLRELRDPNLGKSGLYEKIGALKEGDVTFFRDNGIVSFKIEGPFGAEGRYSALYVWTTSGLTDPSDGGRAKIDDKAFIPCLAKDATRCTASGFDIDRNEEIDDLTLEVVRQPDALATDATAINEIKIRFGRGAGFERSEVRLSEEESSALRSRIIDRGAKISKIAFLDGWLWLKDASNGERRYMVSNDTFLRILKARWRNVTWADDDNFGVPFVIPDICKSLEGCEEELTEQDQGDLWPGSARPSNANGQVDETDH